MKKGLIIIIVVAIVIIGIVLVIFLRGGNAPANSGGTTGTLPPVATNTFVYNPPSGNTIIIGTDRGDVVVNNFYPSAQRISVDHTAVLLVDTGTYNITYYAPDSSFNILIESTPFDAIRPQAESAFLQALNISQTDACKLKVKVGTMVSIDPSRAGKNFGLSFCSSGAFPAK